MDLFLFGVIFLVLFIIGFLGYQIIKFFASHDHREINDQRSVWRALLLLGMLMGGSPFQEPSEPEEACVYDDQEWYDQEPDADDYE